MSEELLINVSPMESRVALLNDGILKEIYIERHNKMGLVGNIYLGTIARVLPGMQAAFIDIGQSRTAFLHVNDMKKIKPANEQKNVTNSALIAPTALVQSETYNHSAQSELSNHNTSNQSDNQSNNQTNNHSSHTQESLETEHNTQVTNNNQTSIQKEHKEHTKNNEPEKKVESFFSSKQFKPDTQNTISVHTNTATRNLATSTDLSVLEKPHQIQANLDDDNTLQTSLNETVNQQPSETREQPKLPKFTILPTVTEILTKKTVTEELHDDGEIEESLNIDGELIETKETPKPVKKQPQVNPQELIQNRLREGQKILVQVTKDQLGTKGARLTTNISLPSRYLVYLPSNENIGISQRIESDEERKRLKAEIAATMQQVQLTGGLIARTAAEGISNIKLKEDIEYLQQLWRMVQKRQQEVINSQNAVLIYQELSLPLRSIRDLVGENTERVIVDDARMYQYLKDFAHEFVPMIYPRIVPYHSQQPMFDVYRVEEDLQDALKKRVNLKSGGYLIIDQTEAMTTIDVNTGSFVGGRSLEDTVYKTNLEATHTIAHQLRLRNLGGIIILDFIDMQEEEHRDNVLISLQSQLSEDYARTNITQISELGLVEMTRKRTRESLEQQLCEPCKTCDGKGFVKTAETVCFEIFRELMRCARTYNAPRQFTVVAHASVIDLLLTSEANTVADLEYLIGRVITFEVESLYTQEQYDIVLD